MSRRKRREEIAAELAARVTAEAAPIVDLEQVAAAEGWTPVNPPRLTEEDVGCICRVAIGTHGVVDPDKNRREWFAHLLLAPSEVGPTYTQYEDARLVHCYRGETGGHTFVVGNAFYDIPFVRTPAGYRGPIGPPEQLGAAFCAVPLPAPLPRVQLILATRALFPGKHNGLGYPDLDASYVAYCANRDVASRVVGPEIASIVASRADWGVSLNRVTLVCVTAAPIASGTDAEQLVAATTRIAGLLPPNPSSLL